MSQNCARQTQRRLPHVGRVGLYWLAHMGGPLIKTPVIDQFAGRHSLHPGLGRFSGLRALGCNLMTGKHAGHASVRATTDPLRAEEEMRASSSRKGYAWGLRKVGMRWTGFHGSSRKRLRSVLRILRSSPHSCLQSATAGKFIFPGTTADVPDDLHPISDRG